MAGSGYDPALLDPTGEAAVSKYANVPEPDGQTSAPGWGTSLTGHDTTPTINPKTVFMGSAKLAKPFYYNGPSTDPWNMHAAEEQQRAAQMETWSTPEKMAVLDHFSSLLLKYGSTNSPGVLWNLAQSGLSVDDPVMQKVLGVDAQASQDSYAQSAPATTASPAATDQGGGFFDNVWPDNIWAVPQFASRNFLSALSMPLEAVQGMWRGAGGAIARDGLVGGMAEAGAQVLSIIPPVAAIIDGSVYADNEFVNPWEQTDFGQTLLYGATRDWTDAFTTAQAGLDLGAAEKLLQTDPNLSMQRQAMIADPNQREKILTDIATQNALFSDPGWFIDETSQIGEAQRQATFNTWAIPGPDGQMTAWTFGRGIASFPVGADWAGYGVTSGFIDAIASIAFDPTIVGAKFGVVSKSLRGIGLLAEKASPKALKGAEMALTFGRERAKVMNEIAVVNRNSQQLLDEYNALTHVEGNPLFKQSPITMEEWAGYDAAQHVSTVRLLKEAQAAAAASRAVAPDTTTLWTRVKKARRAASQWLRGADQYETAWDDTATLARSQGLWEEMQAASRLARTDKGGNVYSSQKYNRWVAGLSPEDKALWDESLTYVESLTTRKRLPSFSDRVAADGFTPSNATDALVAAVTSHYAGRVGNAISGTPPVSKYADRVAGDAVAIITNDADGIAAESIKKVDTAGATVAGEFTPEMGMLGKVDGADAVVYWAGGADPVLRGADEMVDVAGPEFSTRLVAWFKDLVKHPDLRFDKTAVKAKEKDSLVGSVSQQIKDIENPAPGIIEKLNNPGLTFGQVYLLLSEHGFDGFLDDFLRSQGIDGLTGVNRTTRDGIWFGDHPMLEAYRFPEDAADNAMTAGGMVDGVDEFLKTLPATAQRIGVRSMDRGAAQRFMDEAEQARQKLMEARAKSHSTMFEKARAEQAKLDKAREGIAAQFDDPEKALYTILQHEAGMTTSAGRGATVSPEAMRWFLFGNGPFAHARTKALKVMADIVDEADIAKLKALKPGSKEWAEAYDEIAPRYLGMLVQLTKNKWTAETYEAVLKNSLNGGGEDGLLAVLAPRLGVDVFGSAVPRSLKASPKDGLKHIEGARLSNGVVRRTARRMMSERPASREVTLDDTTDVIDAIIKYGMYAKLAPAEIQKLTGTVMLHSGRFDATTTNVDALKKTFTLIGKQLNKNLAESNVIFAGPKGKIRLDELQSAMTDSVQLFLGGHVYKPDVQQRIASGTDIAKFIDNMGNAVEMQSAHLESELITGKLALPSVDEWQAGMGRLAAAIHRFPSTERLYDVARGVYDNLFRTSLLVFRASYILRNSAEMQVRLFLNGHTSIFNDPVSLIGIVLGGKGESRLGKSFSPYAHTVLDTAFNVGDDETAAFANHVQDFFALTRQAHSLTDPRVYRSTIMRGWQPVTVDQPQFAAGWANELILQNRSQLSRAVLGDLPADWKFLPGQDLQESVVKWIRSDVDSAVRTRTNLIAADEGYATIFASESMTRDYLWESKNSVAARIRQFTMDDPVLIEFIKRGEWKGNGISQTISKIPRLEDRVNMLRSALKTRFFDGADAERAMREHMMGKSGAGVVVTVPWIDKDKLKRGSGFVDQFFQFANRIERLGTVGPEFQMAYWDRVAELAPGLRASDVPTALKAARQTLSPLKRMMPDGRLTDLGKNHPAWEALSRASKENTDGMLTLDEIHQIAMKYAATEVQGLFYDAAKRNNFWAATRLIFPFGQAWGNTITQWTKLGSKRPIQVYKMLKALNAATEEGSSAIYEAGQGWMFGQYAEGAAPWDEDPNGGFFYTNAYGDTSFVTPFVGRAASVPINMLGSMNGFNPNMNALDMESSTQSMNLALGSDSLLPGTSFLVPMVLDMLPDDEIVAQAKAAVSPFGTKDVLGSAFPAWLQSTMAGAGAIPGIGGPISDFLSALSPAMKNKNVRDAVAILSTSGEYDMQDPASMQRLEEDAANLASSMLLITGLWKNWMPTSPTGKPGLVLDADPFEGRVEQGAGSYAIGLLSKMYPLYLEENGGDEAAAKEQMLRDFGPSAIFALTRNKSGYMAVPASEARKWAMSDPANYETAKTYPDYFGLFFPKGDYTDVTTRMWMDALVEQDSKYLSPQEIINANVTWMMRVQKARVDFFEGNDLISKAKASAMRADITESYAETDAGQEFNSMGATKRIEQIQMMFDRTPSLQSTQAGRAFVQAMDYRDQALSEARRRSGDPSTTLSGSKMSGIKDAYLRDLDGLLLQYPEFKLLHTTLSKEWD